MAEDPGYTDASEAHRGWEAIRQTTTAGILELYADGMFGPDEAITRGDFALILAKWLNPEELEAPVVFADITG